MSPSIHCPVRQRREELCPVRRLGEHSEVGCVDSSVSAVHRALQCWIRVKGSEEECRVQSELVFNQGVRHFKAGGWGLRQCCCSPGREAGRGGIDSLSIHHLIVTGKSKTLEFLSLCFVPWLKNKNS